MPKLIATISIVLALAGSTKNVGAGEEPAGRARWEYRVMSKDQVLELGKKDLAAGLNQLNHDGWELAAVDGAYIFKRRRVLNQSAIEQLKLRLSLFETEIEMRKERLGWSERMARKGFLSDSKVQAEKLLLKDAEAAADQARRELDALNLPPPQKLPLPQPTPTK
jgi:hypothetical protein